DLLILMDVSGIGLGGDFRQIYPLLGEQPPPAQMVLVPVTCGYSPESTNTEITFSSEAIEPDSTLHAELAPEVATIDSTEIPSFGSQDLPIPDSSLAVEVMVSADTDSAAPVETTLLTPSGNSGVSITATLQTCPRWEPSRSASANSLEDSGSTSPVTPNVHAEVRWAGNSYEYPVRFDDKAALPLIFRGRKPTESELIEFFLSGREPGALIEELQFGESEDKATWHRETPIDTRGILSYFVRRFVQALPGVESQVKLAAYSRPALDSALRGPTSPLELARRAFESLTKPPPAGEPRKTATAVGFQLVELL
ncbi:MAG: hypothetical protein ACKO0N_14155, partial [Planctomycetota bacterium]